MVLTANIVISHDKTVTYKTFQPQHKFSASESLQCCMPWDRPAMPTDRNNLQMMDNSSGDMKRVTWNIGMH